MWQPRPRPSPRPQSRAPRHDLKLMTARLGRLTPPGTARWPGTFRAHTVAICPETIRIGEISAAGQTACAVRSPSSKRCLHETRPTGRLTSGCQPSGRSLAGSRATAGDSSWVTGARPEMVSFRGAGTAALAGAADGDYGRGGMCSRFTATCVLTAGNSSPASRGSPWPTRGVPGALRWAGERADPDR